MAPMTTPLWVPLAAAIVSGASGVAGALGGARLVQRATQEREERQYQRQRKDQRRELMLQLYLDMAQHVEATADWLHRVTDEVTAWSDPTTDYEIPTVHLTPRVELFADADLYQAWSEYVWSTEVFAEELRMAQPSAQFTIADRAPADLRAKIKDIKDQLKSAVDGEMAEAR